MSPDHLLLILLPFYIGANLLIYESVSDDTPFLFSRTSTSECGPSLNNTSFTRVQVLQSGQDSNPYPTAGT